MGNAGPRTSLYVHVAVHAGDRSFDFPLTYRLPESWEAAPGRCVVAPLRGRSELGYVLAVTETPEVPADLRTEQARPSAPVDWKFISEILDTSPVFDRTTASLFGWIARRYVCGMSDAIRCVIPPYRLASVRTLVRLPEMELPEMELPEMELPEMELPEASPGDAGLQDLDPGGADEFRLEHRRVAAPRADKRRSSGRSSPVADRVLETLRGAGGAAELQELQKTIRTPRLAAAIRLLAKRGRIEIVRTTHTPPEGRTAPAFRLSASPERVREWLEEHKSSRYSRQREALLRMQESAGEQVPQSVLMQQLSCSAAPLKALVEKGLLEAVRIPLRRNPWPPPAQIPLSLSLTPDQASALEVILAAIRRSAAAPPGTRHYGAIDGPVTAGALAGAPRPEVVLLRGVTGSGKTEVYLRAIDDTRRLGRQSIALVPEISLTVQMVGIFQARFGSRVAVLHSKLSDGERLDEWERIRKGDVDVVIGARSALFAPVPSLGLIVLDEEHETSYKQDSAPRYHARETAIERARLTGGCVILASATPSLETARMAERGEAHRAMLPRRIDDRPLPGVVLVNQRTELKENPGRIFSRRLEAGIRLRLELKEQVILFLNRRGFATITLCRDCGFVARCRNCDISLTYYASSRLLRCHHCEFTMPGPDDCPSCKGVNIRQFGVGTEKVERELTTLFPEARVARMDVDSMSRKGALQDVVDRFSRYQLDLLIGTQMVAKGFDFPRVTLVGVISADTMLNLPDFRASERSFQLLTQVSGRAGRGDKPGEVIVQTFNPEHYAVQAASHHDFDAFYQEEIEKRKAAGYPPFVHLANILIEGIHLAETRGRAVRAAAALRQAAEGRELEILGPAPAPISRVKARFRWHLLLKARTAREVREACRSLWSLVSASDMKWITIDVDPMSLL